MNQNDVKGRHVKVVYDDGRWLKGRIEIDGRIIPEGMTRPIPCLSWNGDSWVPAKGVMDVQDIWDEHDWKPIACTDAVPGDGALIGSEVYIITEVPEDRGMWVVMPLDGEYMPVLHVNMHKLYTIDLPMVSEFLRPVTKGKENGR